MFLRIILIISSYNKLATRIAIAKTCLVDENSHGKLMKPAIEKPNGTVLVRSWFHMEVKTGLSIKIRARDCRILECRSGKRLSGQHKNNQKIHSKV